MTKATRRIAPAGTTQTSSTIATTQKQNETRRSEHKERAYIAASRRTDRSLEARLASAQMASNIHHERTGKNLRVTTDMIIDEAMYEEEDDRMASRRSSLAFSNQTNGSTATSPCTQAGPPVLSRAAQREQDDKAWDENTINALFAQTFPDAARSCNQEMDWDAKVDVGDLQALASSTAPDLWASSPATDSTGMLITPPVYNWQQTDDTFPWTKEDQEVFDFNTAPIDASCAPVDLQQDPALMTLDAFVNGEGWITGGPAP